MIGFDLTFDTDGRAITDAGSTSEYVGQIVPLDNGKVLAFGLKYASGESNVNIVKYNADGSIDKSFGVAGILNTGLYNGFFGFPDKSVISNGKIIVAGYSANDKKSYVVRYLENGQIDTSFATNGKYILPGDGTPDAIATYLRINPVTRNTEIIVKQISSDASDRALAFTLLDESGSAKTLPFGTNTAKDFLDFNVSVFSDIISNVAAVDQNDPLVKDIFKIFGKSFIDKIRTEVKRFTNNIDPIADISFVSQGDGTIVVGIVAQAPTKGNGTNDGIILLSRLASDGTPDNTFGTNGLLRFDSKNSIGFANSAELIRGNYFYNLEYDLNNKSLLLYRYNKDGKSDVSFGNNGKSILPQPENLSELSLLIKNPNGDNLSFDSLNRLVISISTEGFIYNTRLSENGVVDTTFGKNGVVRLSTGTDNRSAGSQISLSLDNHLFVGGSTENDLLVAKYNIDGTSQPPQTPSDLKIEGDRFFQIAGSPGSKNLSFQIKSQNQPGFHETGIFKVDDISGAINGKKPEDAGYLEAVLDRVQIIASAIPTGNLPQGFDGKTDRNFMVNYGDIFRFYAVNNGSSDQLRQNPTNLNQLTLSEPTTLKVTDTNGNLALNWQNPLNLNLNAKISNTPMLNIGTATQSKSQGEFLDLRQSVNDVTATFSIYREAAYNNSVYFYAIQDEAGTVLDGTTILKPTDSGYIQAALRNAIANVNLSTNNQTTNNTTTTLSKGSLFASLIVVNGNKNSLLDNDINNNPAAYTSFVLGNTDKVDHIRLLGDNTFGFEDLAGGGDLDYNDMIVKVNLQSI